MREEPTLNCLDKVVGSRVLMAAIRLHHSEVERTTTFETAMLPTAEFPQTLAVSSRNGIVWTSKCCVRADSEIRAADTYR